MKKNISILLLATILTNPLYSVTNYEDSDEFEYVPKETLIKFQQLQNENEELKAEIERLKKIHLEGIKFEEKEEKGKESEKDTLPSSSSALSFVEKIGQNGFNPKLIEFYSQFSPTFANYTGTGNGEALINSKTRISRELFLAALRNSGSKEESLLIEESARLADANAYTYHIRGCRDPYICHIEGLAGGSYGFVRNLDQAKKVMRMYGLAGHEEVRRRHIMLLHQEAYNKPSTDVAVQIFRDQVLEYIEQNSDAAFNYYFCHLENGTLGFEKLSEAELIKKMHYYAHEKLSDSALKQYMQKVSEAHGLTFQGVKHSERFRYIYDIIFNANMYSISGLQSHLKLRELILKYAQHHKREIARRMHLEAFANNLYGFNIASITHGIGYQNTEERDKAILEYLTEESEVAKEFYFNLMKPPHNSGLLNTLIGKEVAAHANQGSKVAQRLHIESLDRGLNGFKQDPHEADRLRVEYGIF